MALCGSSCVNSLASFQLGVEKYGLPKKVCSNHRGEIIAVWQYMMTAHGHYKCVIIGSSAHNERIERLWRDVHRSVLVTFGNVFCELSDEDHLNGLNEVNMFCLHTIFISRISPY